MLYWHNWIWKVLICRLYIKHCSPVALSKHHSSKAAQKLCTSCHDSIGCIFADQLLNQNIFYKELEVFLFLTKDIRNHISNMLIFPLFSLKKPLDRYPRKEKDIANVAVSTVVSQRGLSEGLSMWSLHVLSLFAWVSQLPPTIQTSGVRSVVILNCP